MIDYRLYCLDPQGKIQSAEWLTADSDQQALVKARELGKTSPCELWERDRFIASVPAASPSERPAVQ